MATSEQALEIALTLAGVRGVPGSDETLLRRYRLALDTWSMSIVRRLEVGAASDADTVTVDEARHVLDVDAAIGDVIETTTDRFISELDLWLGLIDPDARVLERAQALTGVEPRDLAHRLEALLEVDLAARTFRGTPWRALPRGNSWFDCTVVEHAKDHLALALADARRIAPDAKLGDVLQFPASMRDEQLVLSGPPLHDVAAHSIMIPTENQLEELRSCAAPVETPAALERFELGALRPHYPGGSYGVLYIEIPRADAETRWRALDKAATKTGYRPLILFGDAQGYPPVHELVMARFAWTRDRSPPPAEGEDVIGLQHESHRTDSPEVILAEAERVDVAALLTPGGNPSYPDWKLTSGKSVAPAPRRPLLGSLTAERTRLLLIPTDAAWKVPAFVPALTTSGEATPSLAQVVAVARAWEERWGARVAAIGPAVVEWIVPPLTLDAKQAKQLATEHHTFAPEAYEDTTFEQRASVLVMAGTWHAWWD